MEKKLLILGLEGAGKTTSLYQLKLGHHSNVIPTFGYNMENFDYNGVRFTTYDCSGAKQFRYLWQQNLPDTHVVLFVVDSADRTQINEASEELHNIMRDFVGDDSLLVVLANKQDKPHAMSLEDITVKLRLNSICGRRWCVQPAIALSGDGLYEAFDWICDTMT